MAFVYDDKSPTDVFLSSVILLKSSLHQTKFIAQHCLLPLV